MTKTQAEIMWVLVLVFAAVMLLVSRETAWIPVAWIAVLGYRIDKGDR